VPLTADIVYLARLNIYSIPFRDIIIMSLLQYNSLMSSMLNQKCALAKLRAELEGRQGKLCYKCKKFGHLACNCRNKKEEGKRTSVPQNRFEVLSSRVMRYRVEMRRQEGNRKEREVIRCFKYREEKYQWKECPRKRKEKRERVVQVTALQEVPLKKKLAHFIKRNAQDVMTWQNG